MAPVINIELCILKMNFNYIVFAFFFFNENIKCIKVGFNKSLILHGIKKAFIKKNVPLLCFQG